MSAAPLTTGTVELTAAGGPENFLWAERQLPPPGPGEIRLRHGAIGVNFIDIYHRSGLYPLPAWPAVLGVEGAGVVEAVGADVAGLAVGDRVVYGGAPVGAYAQARLLPAARAVPLPAAVSERQAAALLLRGATAHMLLTRTYRVEAGSRLLVTAAAGGVGSLLCGWAKRLGAQVIGTVGSPEKAELARAAGADHVIVGRDADFAAEVLALTGGRGVDVVYDGIGGATLPKLFGCVRRFGTVASIGQSGGPIAPIPVEALGPLPALSFARPSVMAYVTEPAAYRTAAAALFALLAGGFTPAPALEYPLAEAARAHRDLEAGRTTGSLLLIP